VLSTEHISFQTAPTFWLNASQIQLNRRQPYFLKATGARMPTAASPKLTLDAAARLFVVAESLLFPCFGDIENQGL
jgi:hypothetical protein